MTVRLRNHSPPKANVKAEAQTRVHVIFQRGSGLPHDQAETTEVGGGEVDFSGPEFPLKKLSCIECINQPVGVCEEVQTARGVS